MPAGSEADPMATLPTVVSMTETAHAYGHAQIRSLSHSSTLWKTGQIDFWPRLPSGAEPVRARHGV
jgi:hypothetical protein